MKQLLHFASLLLLAGGTVFAQSTGYFVEGTWQTIPSGAPGVPGPAVAVVSVPVIPGNYLVTARVDGQSYGPNSGASCFFTGPSSSTAWDYTTVNTSSDWSHLQTTSVVMLGKYEPTASGTFTVTCQRGYSFTNSSSMRATISLVPVLHILP